MVLRMVCCRFFMWKEKMFSFEDNSHVFNGNMKWKFFLYFYWKTDVSVYYTSVQYRVKMHSSGAIKTTCCLFNFIKKIKCKKCQDRPFDQELNLKQ